MFAPGASAGGTSGPGQADWLARGLTLSLELGEWQELGPAWVVGPILNRGGVWPFMPVVSLATLFVLGFGLAAGHLAAAPPGGR